MADSKIFVVLDPTVMEQAALEWAEQIALEIKAHQNRDAALFVYCCINESSVAVVPNDYKATGLQRTQARVEAWVERLIGHSRKLGLTVESEVEVSADWRSAIGSAASRHAATLVVKNMNQHTRMMRLIRETSDWQLLRDVDCPVFLVKSGRPYSIKEILVAIKHDPETDIYAAANDRILQTAKTLAEDLGASLHAVTCYESDFSYPDRQRFADRCGLSRDQVTAASGAPEKVIAEAAERLNIDLLIIARVATPGSKSLLGDTAQKVIDETPNEVLVLQVTD